MDGSATGGNSETALFGPAPTCTLNGFCAGCGTVGCARKLRDELREANVEHSKEVGALLATIERYLEAVTGNAPEDERTAAWDALVLTVW